MPVLTKVEAYQTPHGFTTDPEHAIALHLTKIDKDVNNNDLSVSVMAAVVKHRHKVRELLAELDNPAPSTSSLSDAEKVTWPGSSKFADPRQFGNATAFDPIVPDGWYLVKAVQPHEQRVLPSQVLAPLGMNAYRVEFGRINRDISVTGEADTLAVAWREAVEEVERYEISRMK